MSKSSERRLLAVLGTLGLISVGAFAVRGASGSEPIDPSVAQTWVVGAPRGAAPMARLDAARSGRSSTPLPSAPRVRWRARVQGGIAHGVVVDARGAVIVASPIATLTELSPDGKTAWTARTGASPPLTAPVLTSDGTRVVLTSGDLLGFDGKGRARFSVALPASGTRAADPLPLDDGGLVISIGRSVLHLDRRGTVRATTKMDSDVVALVRRGSETLVLSDLGGVHAWRPPAEPTEIASFGGRIDGAALGGGVLTAVVDQRKLVDLNLETSTRLARAEAPLGLSGPPALTTSGATRVVTFDGLLLGHDKQGNETLRAALEPPTLLGDGGATLSGGAGTAPAVVSDAQGRVAFVRPGLDAGTVDSAGNIQRAPGAACLDPVSIVPAGAGRMVLACRSGVVFLLGDR